MKKVVYFGMGFLPNKNAVANRELVLAKMITQCGYVPVLVGISKEVKQGEYVKHNYNGIDYYVVNYAEGAIQKLRDSFLMSTILINIMEEIDVSNISCFIMQDYQLNTMKKMCNYCEKNNVKFVPDIMDWFTPTADATIFKNVFKSIDTYIRMKLFYPSLKYRLCISHTFEKFFEKNSGFNYVIPCTSVCAKKVNQVEAKRPYKLVFAGHPGIRLQKEKLDWVIRALYENNSDMILQIIGVDYEYCVKNNPEINQYITSKIEFKGKMAHEECVSILQNSDFSVVIRKKNNLSIYGFSSKICEAFNLGIPVLATDVSDNSLYIKDGLSGFVCISNYEAVKEMLYNVERLEPDAISEMKAYINEHNPLMDIFYVDEMKRLIEESY